MKIYPKPNVPEGQDAGFTAEEVRSNQIMLYADVKCEDCGKEHALSNTRNGRCIKCGGRCS